MTQRDLNNIINFIIDEGIKLKNKYITQDLIIDYICIFSQSQTEYEDLKKLALKVGDEVDNTPTGPIFKFKTRPETKADKPYLLRIRIYDATRPERGDLDFNTQHSSFKKKYLNNIHFKLIERKDYEMIELMDPKFKVRVYFSSRPLSKDLGIS